MAGTTTISRQCCFGGNYLTSSFRRNFVTSRRLVLVCLWQCALLAMPSQATIYTYNNSVSFEKMDYAIQDAYPSLPGLFGVQMDNGVFYRARLQFMRNNPYLCQDEQDAESRTNYDSNMGTFVVPEDYTEAVDPLHGNATSFVPVALLAARGFCPFHQKAVTAESFGNAVQFLIVYNNDMDGEDVLVPMYSEYGSTRLILLSVTHRTGQSLKRYIASQTEDVIDAGGPFVGFNDLPPEGILTVEDLQNYVLSALGLFFMFVSLSGCLLVWTGRRQMAASRIILVGGEVPAAVVGASSASRRLLTEAQVQQLAEAQRNHLCIEEVDEAVGAASLTTVSHHDDDCCAVCMEDFEQDAEQSDANISLPCGHLFHKDCVIPWLTQRQSKCPLCKFDVAEYLRQLQTGQGERAGSTRDGSTWNPLNWLRYRSWTAVSAQDGDGIVRADGGVGERPSVELAEQRHHREESEEEAVAVV